MSRNMIIKSSLMAAILALFIPMAAAAQGGYDPWGRPDYRRGSRYDSRYLRDSIHRLDRLAKNFERDLDRVLDRSHEDGTRHEDRVNNEARDFREAVSDLKSSFGNGRDLNRSTDEARRVLHEGNRAERVVRHHFNNYRLASQWSQIQRELNFIANAYGQRSSVYDDDYRNDRRRNDDYRRRNPNDVPWWQRIPGFPN